VCDNLGGTPCTIAGASSTLRESPDVGQSPACGAELRKLP
jgi:hypothetical protein